MARPKKPFTITTMKVPTKFRELVVANAEMLNMEPTDYLNDMVENRRAFA